jgi:hypothetical protein
MIRWFAARSSVSFRAWLEFGSSTSCRSKFRCCESTASGARRVAAVSGILIDIIAALSGILLAWIADARIFYSGLRIRLAADPRILFVGPVRKVCPFIPLVCHRFSFES